MCKKLLVLCAVIVFSVNLAFADEGSTKVSVSPAPLFKDPATGMEFVFVKGGCYQMGDMSGDGTDWHGEGESNERPVHEVCVDDFYMGKYEVTRGQWKKITGSYTPTVSLCVGDNCPVDMVNWNEIQDFISKMNSNNGGSKYRLPTEAEWEYAARSGGKYERYSGGNDVDSVAWYNANSGEKPHAVGTKLPNGLGIYDMNGNVWEMTNDWYAGDYYSSSPRNNPTGPSSGEQRVKRGGCATGPSTNVRTTRRSVQPPEMRGSDGFRLLRAP
jgi:formylglycine-generating enzyme required for sulfatase activity